MSSFFIIIDRETASCSKQISKIVIIVKNRLEARNAVKKVFQKAKLILTTDKVYFWIKPFLDSLMKIKRNYPIIVFILNRKTLKGKVSLIENLALKLSKSA
jgi:hypothetical protein